MLLQKFEENLHNFKVWSVIIQKNNLTDLIVHMDVNQYF
jgi:hypothetical protein